MATQLYEVELFAQPVLPAHELRRRVPGLGRERCQASGGSGATTAIHNSHRSFAHVSGCSMAEVGHESRLSDE